MPMTGSTRRTLRSLSVAGVTAFVACGASIACGSFDSNDAGALDEAGTADASAADASVDAPIDVAICHGLDCIAVEQSSNLPGATKIVADATHVYVALRTTPGAIVRVSLDGTTRDDIATGLDSPVALAIGPEAVFFATSTSRVGARFKDLASPAISAGTAEVVVDLAGVQDKVYVAEAVQVLAGFSQDLSSSFLVGDVAKPSAIAVAGGSVLYVASSPAAPTLSPLHRLTVGATAGPIEASADVFPAITAIAADGDEVFFAEGGGTVRRFPAASFFTPGGAAAIASGGPVVGIVLDRARRASFWITDDGVVHRYGWDAAAEAPIGRGPVNASGITQTADLLFFSSSTEGKLFELRK
jgi:hypothetical protein